jgi:hypothetical protein
MVAKAAGQEPESDNDRVEPMEASKSLNEKEPLVRFYQLVDGFEPRRADKSVGGTLPVRALRHSGPSASASQFGWYVFLPHRFRLLWDGNEVFYQLEDMPGFEPLRTINYPGLADSFDAAAPEHAKGFSPPFLTASVQTGSVQVWPGLMARTAPGWSLLVRPIANFPRRSGYELFEGIIETDQWFGPLITNLRLTRTDVPVEFDNDIPFMQVQPLQQGHYDDHLLSRFEIGKGAESLGTDDWQRYTETVVKPNTDPNRRRGTYAAKMRKSESQRTAEDQAVR